MLMLSSSTIHCLLASFFVTVPKCAVQLMVKFTVDAHVGKALFADAITGALKNHGKTVILVTHALHFLPQCDYIYTMQNGRIAEQGTYEDLLNRHGEFARLMAEFGGKKEEEKEERDEKEEDAIEEAPTASGSTTLQDAKQKSIEAIKSGSGTGKLEGRLIRAERRTTGSVGWRSAC